MPYQVPIPDRYHAMEDEAVFRAIRAHKQRFGKQLVILGHHYQQDEVIQFADFVGDSLKLSQLAAEQAEARYVIFCGVHFMAESADILTDEEVVVILPDLAAGCSMADMATLEQAEEAWCSLTAAANGVPVVPITYVNSAASIKAFCGEHDGACCTSSNARRVLEWALQRHPEGKVLFLPDQHLGRNTAYAMGWPLESMVVYDPAEPDGGLTAEQVRSARFILWNGYCSVHQLFRPEQCDQIRQADPECKIIVHPECTWQVVQKADLAGSTEFIVKTIREAPAGSRWAVGTEIHLVHRLAEQHRGQKQIRLLAGIQCLCTTMYRIDPRHLLWVLDNLAQGRIVNRIRVDAATRRLARIALERMLALRTTQPTPAPP